jgi:excisionase family DNA binding protein
MSRQSTALSRHERGEGARSTGALKGQPELPDPMRPLTVKEAATILDCNAKTLYAAIAKGQIPAIRVSKLFLIPRQAFEKLLRDGTTAEVA